MIWHREASAPLLRLVGTALVDVGQPIDGVDERGDAVRNVPIAGGRFDGNEFSGRIASGGSDHQIIRGDLTTLIDARFRVVTTRGQAVDLRVTGYRHGPASVLRRLAQGEIVDPSEYYFRTAITASTSDEDLSWMTRTVLIGTGARQAEKVTIDVFAVR
ncbi:DUF3237 family protein [Microbacterium sp. PMB16]|uniref:DUF3237 family protein n=1 Tax=Microbacterium sp. PMB16 TaxID=3120157 RepID=UPI003F4B4433